MDDLRSRTQPRTTQPERDYPRTLRRLRTLLAAGVVVLALSLIPIVAGYAPPAAGVALVGVLLIWIAIWRRSRLIPEMRAARKRREALLQAFAEATVPAPSSVLNEPWRDQAPQPATVADGARLAAIQTRAEREAQQVAATLREQLAGLDAAGPAHRRAAYETAIGQCDARRAGLETWLLGDPKAVREASGDLAASATALLAALEIVLEGARADRADGRNDTPVLRQLLAFDAALGTPAGADDQVALSLCSEVCKLLDAPLVLNRQAYAALYARQQEQEPVALDLPGGDVDRLVRVLADGARERGAGTEQGWSRYPFFTRHLGAEIGAWDQRQPVVRATFGAAARRHLAALLEAHIAYRDRLLGSSQPMLGSLRRELAEGRARDAALLDRLRQAPDA